MKVLLVANSTNIAAIDAVHTVEAWLERHGISTVFASGDDVVRGTPAFEQFAKRIGDFDFVCSFGGDGTTLRAAHVIGGTGVPLLGFNFGKLGFLAGATAEGLIPAIEALLAGEVVQERRSILHARIAYSNGLVDEQIALNELMLSRKNIGRVIDVSLFINGSLVSTIRGDGMLVATATGSTAYALSAGGPLLSPELRGLVVVPLSPHRLDSRAIVTAASDVVELRPLEREHQKVAFFFDGETVASPDAAAEVESIQLSRHPDDLITLRYNTPDYYTAISHAFFGSDYAR
ncbi:MAG: NAD(+)/NADH kinase [Coriobacteriales bacterium]|jgi:NAD+ kinase|nr:NAD(+)/NADH kinase [Coriobacteriales bacterium]